MTFAKVQAAHVSSPLIYISLVIAICHDAPVHATRPYRPPRAGLRLQPQRQQRRSASTSTAPRSCPGRAERPARRLRRSAAVHQTSACFAPGGLGDGGEFLAITACVLGGTSLAGGVAVSVLPGTLRRRHLLLQHRERPRICSARTSTSIPIVRGIVIYLAMVTDSLKRSIGGKA